jgi:AcrR family transcriptional regulator
MPSDTLVRGGVLVARRLRPNVTSERSALRGARLAAPGVACEPAGVAATRLGEIQRSRLLQGAVATIDELGYAQATVAHITGRARVSRRTFYELFTNREECVAAVLDDLAAEVHSELARGDLQKLPWSGRIRAGLWRILELLEREPALARVCVVESLRGTGVVLERREALLVGLLNAVDGGRYETARGAKCSELTAEGIVGATLAIIQTRLARAAREPLTDLLGELMAIIVLPYLGEAAARRERARPLPPRSSDKRPTAQSPSPALVDPLDGLSMRVTYRTARVLERVGEQPGASNRQIAEQAGIQDQGQVSKLLARLEGLGLIVNEGRGRVKGEPNAWTLSPRGAAVAHSVIGCRGAATGTRAA